MAVREPDDVAVVLFKHQSFKNEDKSLAEGREIHDDIEICEIRFPGAKDWKAFPATALSTQKIIDPYTGAEKQITYAERFRHQYMQFKAHAAQTKSGTPLDFAPFLTAARRAELRAQNVYTIEQLAAIDGQELKNLGPGGRGYKNNAEEYLAEAKAGAPNLQMAAELEALRARNAVLEGDAKIKAERAATAPTPTLPTETDYDDMTIEQLREYIMAHTGIPPTGSLSHKSLKHLAQGIAKSKAA
jgi:hypothetical protein